MSLYVRVRRTRVRVCDYLFSVTVCACVFSACDGKFFFFGGVWVSFGGVCVCSEVFESLFSVCNELWVSFKGMWVSFEGFWFL